MIHDVEIWSNGTRENRPQLLEVLKLDTSVYQPVWNKHSRYAVTGYYKKGQKAKVKELFSAEIKKFLADNNIFHEFKEVDVMKTTYRRDGIVTVLPSRITILCEVEDDRPLPIEEAVVKSESYMLLKALSIIANSTQHYR